MFENFSWKAGTSFPVKAETAAKTIRDLQKTLGKDSVTAKELLDDSRDANAPLHPCFEWNNDIAAEKYRLSQASYLIRSLEVRYIGDTTPRTVRAYLSVTPSPSRQQGKFVGIDVILSKENYRKQVLSNALIELRAFQRKYSTQEELLGVFKAIDAFADTLQ